ncbi:MAG TPA: polyprenyl synthetase family protein [Longimicrobium sp.]|nr:polyprenyl synthetase family protein [Longimicrobium sp.]
MAVQALEPHPPGMADVARWLSAVQARVEREMAATFAPRDEDRLNPQWLAATGSVRGHSLRQGPRLRAAMLGAAHGLVTGASEPPPSVWRFAAGLELLHGYVLIHDEVTDVAGSRGDGPALHRMLSPGRIGVDLSVVAGDYLFARAVEVMLDSGLPGAPAAVTYLLAICRQTSAGRFVERRCAGLPLALMTPRQVLAVARLKTARYGFVAPLVSGAMLGGASDAVLAPLKRAGRHLGFAYHLREELAAFFGEPLAPGEPTGEPLQGPRGFPVVAAYLRAAPAARRAMDALWDGPLAPSALPQARALVEANGGRGCTERLILRSTRLARQALREVPQGPSSELLDLLAVMLARRMAG